MLRSGNVHSAHDWWEVLEPILARYERTGVRRYFRADAAFAKREVYEYLEERSVLYAIRLPSNDVLHGEIQHLLNTIGRKRHSINLHTTLDTRIGSAAC